MTTLHHATARPPPGETLLVVDTRRGLLDSRVLTAVRPGFSADGRALVSTSLLGSPRPADTDAALRTLGEAYGTDTFDWEAVRRVTVPDATSLSRTTRWAPGRYVCGGRRATGSLQSALASGTRAARTVRGWPRALRQKGAGRWDVQTVGTRPTRA
ncbi:hypothetical protein HHL19_18470 [Streptomyces sp. R302]|uniref:hypothetical protein n=1 Tax=unclassified Streptomyces TaxID=2593676 RepID=UPI00145CD749|nr:MULTISPECIES: hypothetical protein [unclassified Streptomyces]NML52466.1 hypothetical protein [Streptomyces sp. R301]NML80605.1 hypothetical protein [Streptomyces sp. R302]